MQVMVDGLLTHYERSGKGRIVLLLHGWTRGEANFGTLPAYLAKDFTVLMLHLPGFGGTTQPPSVWDLTDYAMFVRHFLEKLEVKSVYTVIGHSNGGAIALRGLGAGILTANKLVLLASAGVRAGHEGRKMLLRIVSRGGKILTFPLPQSAKQHLKRRFHQAIGSDLFVNEHLQATFTKIVRDDVQADAAKISIPTLLLYGENDTDTPVAYGELLHQLIADSTLEVLPNAGHFVFLDRPSEVDKRIMEFLR